jgi:ACR3 family arsenite efflux pump ArsB
MSGTVAQPIATSGGLGTFERYLSVWVALCMGAGVLIGKLLPGAIAGLRGIEFARGSQINAPIAVLIWLMITPMMMKVDFSSVRNVGKRPAGLLVTLFINWVVKPFSMALFAWAFLPAGVRIAHNARRSGPVHRRLHHSGRGTLYGHGLRMEPLDGRGSGIHACAGFCE